MAQGGAGSQILKILKNLDFSIFSKLPKMFLRVTRGTQGLHPGREKSSQGTASALKDVTSVLRCLGVVHVYHSIENPRKSTNFMKKNEPGTRLRLGSPVAAGSRSEIKEGH